jgi:hypothetical protein
MATPSKSCTTIAPIVCASRNHNNTQTNSATRSIVKNGEAHILACHHLSYGQNKIAPPNSTNTPTKKPKAMAISTITSWVDGGFSWGLYITLVTRSQGAKLLGAGIGKVPRPMARKVRGPVAR